MRFTLAVLALAFSLGAQAQQFPSKTIKIIAPWRMEKFRQRFPGRSEMIAFCNQKKIPVKASLSKPYSSDENCLHISYEAGKLEDLNVNGVDLVEFGMVTLRMSLFSDAVQAFQDVLKVRRDDHNAVYALGRARIGLRKYQDAKDSFSEYTRLRPDDPSGHYGLGLVLRSLEQTKEARVQFEHSVALQPAQTESYVQLGKLDLDERSLDSAADRFNHALQRDPRNAGALLGMGEVEFQRKRYQTSKDFLSRAIASDPSSRESHYYLGLVYGRLGRLDDSKQEFEVASKLEHEELEKQRTLWSLVDPAEIDSAQPK